jgi:hypothetical protein
VEYLYQRGLLGIDNLELIDKSDDVVPIRYRRLDGDAVFDISNL